MELMIYQSSPDFQTGEAIHCSYSLSDQDIKNFAMDNGFSGNEINSAQMNTKKVIFHSHNTVADFESQDVQSHVPMK